MTRWLTGIDVAARVRERFPEAVAAANTVWLEVLPAALVDVARFLRDDPELALDQATNVTCVDWIDYFEVVYHLQSITLNQIITVKCRPESREDPIVPSVSAIWQGAWLQEMEIYDLMGIRFSDHPDLRRLFLWEGFAGWPLRKDFLQVGQGTFSPGLPHFPKEGGEAGLLNGPNWAKQPGAVPLGRRKGEPGNESGWAIGAMPAPGEAFKQ